MKRGCEALTELERKVLNLIQKDFPVSSRPYRVIARQLEAEEEQVFEVVQKLKERKVIRRLGGFFDSKKMGFSSTLVALKVAPDHLEEVAKTVSSLESVTHNYQRSHAYNLWFTLIEPSKDDIKSRVGFIAGLAGVEKIMELPAVRLFKIVVNLNL